MSLKVNKLDWKNTNCIVLSLENCDYRFDVLLDLCWVENVCVEIDFNNKFVYVEDKNGIWGQLKSYDFIDTVIKQDEID